MIASAVAVALAAGGGIVALTVLGGGDDDEPVLCAVPAAVVAALAPEDWCQRAPVTKFVEAPAVGPLSAGDSGERVKRLQEALQRAEPLLNADGFFGRQTELAVMVLQAESGLAVDGIAGPDTYAELNLPYP